MLKLLNETVNTPCSKRRTAAHMLTETFFKWIHIFILSLFLWLSTDLKSDLYNLTCISLFSILVCSHQGSFYICNEINSSKRKTIKVKHSDKHTVAVQWGPGEMSSIDLNRTQPLWQRTALYSGHRKRQTFFLSFLYAGGRKSQAENIQDNSHH